MNLSGMNDYSINPKSPLTNSPTHLFTHSPIHLFTHSPIHQLPPAYSLQPIALPAPGIEMQKTHIHILTYSHTHLFTYSHTHLFTYSHTHLFTNYHHPTNFSDLRIKLKKAVYMYNYEKSHSAINHCTPIEFENQLSKELVTLQ